MMTDNLKIVFDDGNGLMEVEMPLYRWISDWWFDCNSCPSNDAVLISAELGGKPVMDGTDGGSDATFLNMAEHMGWTTLHDDFKKDVSNGGSYDDSVDGFEKWLMEHA